MSPRVDRYGDPLDDDKPLNRHEGADLCRHALEKANAARTCPACGGALRPGWLIHPSCRESA